ncbi:MAG: FAD-dependent oxidoreductase [Candidatus Methanoperedens sp.]|nr:FAD-dependent oxidoreductase [Candidatus Methanoperedens sp.]
MVVEVRFNSKVSEVRPDELKLIDGSIIQTYTVAWTAGVRGEPELKNWGLPTNSNGRVTVLNTLQVPGYPNVYAVGDLAYLEEDGHPLPMVGTSTTIPLQGSGHYGGYRTKCSSSLSI